MADQCYLFFNSCINVDSIKIDTNISNTFDQAFGKKDEMLSTTVLFNSFTDTIDASYFAPDNSISGANFSIYRKTPSQKYYDFICELQNGEFQFTDYNVVNNEYYHYLAAVELSTSSGVPEYQIYQNREESGALTYLKTHWGSWSICDIEDTLDENIYVKTGNTWVLKFNISGEQLTQNLSVTTWDSLGQYPKISIGQKNYTSSSFSGLLGQITEYEQYNNFEEILLNQPKEVYEYTEKYDVTNPYARENEKLERWIDFCYNGKLKLLKDIKGNAWVVQIVSNPTNDINLQSNYQLTTINFEWQEVLDINTISIVSINS